MTGETFPRNEHPVERTIRVVLGLGILSLTLVSVRRRVVAPNGGWGPSRLQRVRGPASRCGL
jgi:hypothetical protein